MVSKLENNLSMIRLDHGHSIDRNPYRRVIDTLKNSQGKGKRKKPIPAIGQNKKDFTNRK